MVFKEGLSETQKNTIRMWSLRAYASVVQNQKCMQCIGEYHEEILAMNVNNQEIGIWFNYIFMSIFEFLSIYVFWIIVYSY